jgi:hypothetical protein
MNTPRTEQDQAQADALDVDRAEGPDTLTASDIALALDCLASLADAADKLATLLDTLQPIVAGAAAMAAAQLTKRGGA